MRCPLGERWINKTTASGRRPPPPEEGTPLRIVVFTGDRRIETTPWWPIVLATPGLSGLLICVPDPPRGVRAALRSVRRNVRKHGLIFVPYRLGVLIRDGLSAALHPPAPEPTPPCSVPCRRILAADLHSKEVVSAVRAWSPDLGLSLGAPILRPALFQLPKYGTLNLHLGKVPNFRGAPPAFWELYTG
ncbi:MAG: hypothetical protein ACREL4_03280, partial [Gemmatimonadales bacterium]